jgi:hypothetical protein
MNDLYRIEEETSRTLKHYLPDDGWSTCRGRAVSAFLPSATGHVAKIAAPSDGIPRAHLVKSWILMLGCAAHAATLHPS